MPTLEERQAAIKKLDEQTKENAPKSNKFFVLFSEEHGILLNARGGILNWSKTNPGPNTSAICFKDGTDEANIFVQNSNVPYSNIPEHRAVPIFPDMPRDRASIDACANAQLPRWVPEAAKSADEEPTKVEPKEPESHPTGMNDD